MSLLKGTIVQQIQRILQSRYGILLLAAGSCLAEFFIFYPGFLSGDSIDQYWQAEHLQFNDWHPPIMAGLWSVFNYIHKGPESMLFFQLLLLWSSFYILASTWFRTPRSFLILFILLFAAPYIQNFAPYIIKDVQMALSWLLAIAIVLKAMYYRQRMSVLEAIISLLLITYGAMIRINALPGALPVCFVWFSNIFPAVGKYRRWLFSVLILIIIVLVQNALTLWIFKPEKRYPEYKLFAHDIAGIYIKTGKLYFPGFITGYNGFDTGYIKEHYTTATFDNIWWPPDDRKFFPPLSEATKPVLAAAWKQSIRENPAAYLEDRFDGYLYFLRIRKRPSPFYYHFLFMPPNQYGFTFKDNIFSKAITGVIEFQEYMPYMTPWFWMLAAVVLIYIAARRRNSPLQQLCLLLPVSSLLYYLPQFFIFQVDTDFRYFYWGCIAATLSTILLVIDRSEKKRRNVATES